jgi:hypothetical protein
LPLADVLHAFLPERPGSSLVPFAAVYARPAKSVKLYPEMRSWLPAGYEPPNDVYTTNIDVSMRAWVPKGSGALSVGSAHAMRSKAADLRPYVATQLPYLRRGGVKSSGVKRRGVRREGLKSRGAGGGGLWRGGGALWRVVGSSGGWWGGPVGAQDARVDCGAVAERDVLGIEVGAPQREGVVAGALDVRVLDEGVAHISMQVDAIGLCGA